jgi:hypothetical protein
MSDLRHACEVISEAGCYADNEIRERAEFERVDRQNRIAVAAKDLVNWFDGSLPRIFDIAAVAELIATAMLAQFEHDEKERIARQIVALNVLSRALGNGPVGDDHDQDFAAVHEKLVEVEAAMAAAESAHEQK